MLDISFNDISNDFENEEELRHYGMPRRSGRYPWGSGEDPYQHSKDFVGRYNELEKAGMSHDDIIKSMGLSTGQYRALNAIALNERRLYDIAKVESMVSDGYNNSEIARKLGLPSESSVRSLLNEGAKARSMKALQTANILKDAVDGSKGKFIDIGAGVEKDLDISPEKLKAAEAALESQGYKIYSVRVPQVNNPGKGTTMKLLCPPGTEYKDAYKALEKGEITSLSDYENTPNVNDKNDQKRRQDFVYPSSMDSNRVMIRYKDDVAPDGHKGVEKDGLVEIRPGVEDLNLGKGVNYAQVRILVDGTHYIKGMAVYNDDIPKGYDVVFNTNKGKDKSKMEVLKEIHTEDPDNPFGSLIKDGGQSYYIDSKTGEKKLSLINKRAEEGDWGQWSNKLASQFLVKQNKDLITKQLATSIADKQAEYEEICSLTNPTLKKQLLNTFAEDCDSSAVYLHAAALPRQKYQVIMPIASLKDNECYAPNYKDGEMVSLVRFPHEGTYQIPQLVVNNKNKEGRKLLSNTPLDAIGINSKVAERMSGADFDGDTVLVIPTNDKIRITSTPPLKGLKDFDSKTYQYDEPPRVDSEGNKHYYRNGKEFRIMNNTQAEMGKISNLITDMTIKGASPDELAKATRHAMVVIDAEKHKLDYKASEIENDIQSLKNIYQPKENGKKGGGASTLLSRAKSEERVDKREGNPKVNLPGEDWYDPSRPDGALIYKTASDKKLYYTTKKTLKDGTVVETKHKRQDKSTKMAETDDARTLSSGTLKEELYAEYANALKAMANKARIEISKTGKIAYNKSAAEQYKDEVADLNRQLLIAEKNKPRERLAQALANSIANAKRQENPSMEKDQYKKIAQQELTRARNKLGAKKEKIRVSDSQWEAIQKGAISETTLKRILLNMDADELRVRATPRTNKNVLSTAKVAQIKAKSNSGYTTSEIAEDLGVSEATVRKYLK